MAVLESLNVEDRKLKLEAANALKISPASLDASNPFDPQSTCNHSLLISEWLRLNYPQKASEMLERAGVQLSLEAQSVAEGNSEMTQAVWQELQQKDPGWIYSQRQAAEARMLSSLEEQAERFVAAGKKQREALRHGGPNTATAQHCNDWNRSMQGRMHLPARRLSGR